ncbi:Oxidative stress-induced growth inhibitor 2 [Mortierella sp. NVP85]|nr:Oxidative stress-induced growth inhibitor 2 [Mortierella sp. NVP85]
MKLSRPVCDGFDSPPPTPVLAHSSMAKAMKMATVERRQVSTARPHIVLGRGDVGGIWADMEQDHNQTLSYHEHMELPLYSFKEFLQQHPEHGNADLERPLRSTVSAYYKTYVQQVGIQSNFSNHTTVTGIYHLKDLENHCCCAMDPQQRQGRTKGRANNGRAPMSSTQNTPKSQNQSIGGPCRTCAQFRYAILGYIETTLGSGDRTAKKRTKFLIRSKTVVLATGTFDQPKKLPAASIHPCTPPPPRTSAGATIQQTFHDTRQLEEWMVRNSIVPMSLTPPGAMTLQDQSNHTMAPTEVSPPPSPPASSSLLASPTLQALDQNVPLSTNMTTTESPTLTTQLPIVIVGTGLSAADAILLIQEKQPWRRIIHIYKHFSASEPSPLKRCHRDVYPEYASVWVRMKKSATLKNSVQSYSSSSSSSPSSRHCSVFGDAKSADSCDQCKALLTKNESAEPTQQQLSPLCTGCSYRGLPDASVSSWDPVTGEIVIILSHGVVIQERVAAVGVFIGKQVHMGFLKGSLSQELLSTGGRTTSPSMGGVMKSGAVAAAKSRLGRKSRHGRRDSSIHSDSLTVDIPTPPCTPPRSPVLKPRNGPTFGWQKLVFQAAAQGLGLLRRERKKTKKNKTNEKDESSRVVKRHEGTVTKDAEGGGVEGIEDMDEDAEELDDDSDDTAELTASDDDYKVDESQVLTLLKPLVSDLYTFRIIPTGVTATSPGYLGDPMAMALPTIGSPALDKMAPAYPMKPKRCTRLPCYPLRHSSATAIPEESNESKTTRVVSQVDSLLLLDHGSDKKHDLDQDTEGDMATAEGGKVAREGIVGRMTRTMSSCISMPCSPLLGCRTMCSELGTPPPLTLCSTAATTASATTISTVATDTSSSPPPEASPSLSTTTTTTTPLQTCKNTHASTTAVGIAAAEDRQSHVGSKGQVVAVEEYDEIEDGEEEVIAPLMDQSIYAAGAITGSKFVRYVLGNGIAIVADILRSETP